MFNRNKDSHKGQNGKVLVVGGSSMLYGAPILAALGAENSGVDLVYPYIPKSHAETAKTYSLNFILQTFHGDNLSSKDVSSILSFSDQVDVVVIGPGLGSDTKTKTIVRSILTKLTVPSVVDAGALIFMNSFPKNCVLTPHRGEFKELTGDDPTAENVQKWAKDLGVTIVCKAPDDIISNGEDTVINTTGNAMMTVGGTGDVLAGFIGGLMAQGMLPFEAGELATRVLGLTAESFGGIESNLKAIDLAYALPASLSKF